MGKIVTWQEVAAQKKDLQSAQIPDKWKLKNVNFPRGSNVMGVPTTCGILTPEEIRITSDYDAVDIVQLIKNKTFSAEAVTTAFCKRAAIAQQLVRIPSSDETRMIAK
jgi:amidase